MRSGSCSILLVLFLLVLASPARAIAPTRELASAELRQDEHGLYLFLSDPLGKELRINEFQQNRVTNLIEVDLPGISYQRATLAMTHTLPGVSLFRVASLSEDPPVVRMTIFFTPESRHHVLAHMQKNRLYVTGHKEAEPAFAVGAMPRAPREEEQMNLDFDNTDLMTILNALAIKMGLTLVADAGVKGVVSIHSQNSKLREILDALLLSRGFKYSLSGNQLTIISPIRNPMETRQARELFFKDMPLKDALQTASRMLNINIIIHDSVQDKTVDFYIENLPLDELFNLLLKTNGLIKKQYNANTFIILDEKESSTFGNLVYRTYKLVNTKPSVVQSTLTAIDSLKNRVNTKNWAVSEELNQMVVYDTPEAHEIIEQVIASVDEKPSQVTIEMKLLEINRTKAKELGFDIINGIRMGPNNTFPKNVDMAAKLSFLEQHDKAKVLASPRIRAMSKKPASIHIGQTIPVPYSEFAVGAVTSNGVVAPGSVSPQNVAQAVSQEIKRFKDVPVGIQLQVTPEIFRDREVELDVNINVDTVLNISAEGQITKSTKTTNTRIRVKDGETVVFGGLIQQKESNTSAAPPFLNQVPGLADLFRRRNDIQDSELVLLLTPILVDSGSDKDLPKNLASSK